MEIIYFRQSGGVNKWVAYDLDDATIETLTQDRSGLVITSTSYLKYLGPNTSETGVDVMFHDVNADAYPDMVYRFTRKNTIRINQKDHRFGLPKLVSVTLPGEQTTSTFGEVSPASSDEQ